MISIVIPCKFLWAIPVQTADEKWAIRRWKTVASGLQSHKAEGWEGRGADKGCHFNSLCCNWLHFRSAVPHLNLFLPLNPSRSVCTEQGNSTHSSVQLCQGSLSPSILQTSPKAQAEKHQESNFWMLLLPALLQIHSGKYTELRVFFILIRCPSLASESWNNWKLLWIPLSAREKRGAVLSRVSSYIVINTGGGYKKDFTTGKSLPRWEEQWDGDAFLGRKSEPCCWRALCPFKSCTREMHGSVLGVQQRICHGVGNIQHWWNFQNSSPWTCSSEICWCSQTEPLRGCCWARWLKGSAEGCWQSLIFISSSLVAPWSLSNKQSWFALR